VINILVSDYPDVVELGSKDLGNTYTESFNFVNVAMTSSGPSNLILPLAQTRASIQLGEGKDGVVLVHAGGKLPEGAASLTALNTAGLQASYIAFLKDNEVNKYRTYTSGNPANGAYLFDLDTENAKDAELAQLKSGDKGLSRNALEITSATVTARDLDEFDAT
jgi:hypothetical protein